MVLIQIWAKASRAFKRFGAGVEVPVLSSSGGTLWGRNVPLVPQMSEFAKSRSSLGEFWAAGDPQQNGTVSSECRAFPRWNVFIFARREAMQRFAMSHCMESPPRANGSLCLKREGRQDSFSIARTPLKDSLSAPHSGEVNVRH